MDAKHLTVDDWFIAAILPEYGDDPENDAREVCVLERLSTGERIEATPSEVAEVIRAKRVFWRL